MTEAQIIEQAYNKGAEDEYNRLVSCMMSEVEFDLVTELIMKYARPGDSVADIGSGPGRYAEYLLSKKCRVGLADLSGRSLELFLDRTGHEFRESILFVKKACATDLSFIPTASIDLVLLMGPMYHLTSLADRKKALAECYRILKPGGVVFITFLSIFPCLYFPDHQNNTSVPRIEEILNTGLTSVDFQGYRVPQYCCFPSAAMNAACSAGFSTLHVRNIEGMGAMWNTPDYPENKFINSKEELLEKLRLTCDHKDLLGFTHQFIYVGVK